MLARWLLVALALISSSALIAQDMVPSTITVRVGSTADALVKSFLFRNCGSNGPVASVALHGSRLVVRGNAEGRTEVICSFLWSRYNTVATIGYVEVRPNLLPLPCPPEVVVKPRDVEVVFGTTVTMSAIATARDSTFVQWYWGRTGDTSNPVEGAVAPSLEFRPTTEGVFNFWPRVTSACGTTDGATVTIRSKPCLPPSITRQPRDVEQHPGGTVTLSIEDSGGGWYLYQWFRGESGDASAPLSVSSRKSIEVRASGYHDRYWVRVSDACGRADSRAASVSPLTRSRPTDSLRPVLPSNGILFIGAHPDDEVLVAPLLGEVCAEGQGKCTILIATRGERGLCELPGGCARSELAAIRTEEEMRSASLLDATLSAGELPDGSAATPEEVLRIWSELLGGRDQLVQRLIREIVVSGADSIITFDPRHGSTCHPDHRAIGRLAADAVAAMGSAAPRTYFLTTRANQTSGLDGSESVQLTHVDQEGEREFRYDAELRWHYVVDVAQIHRSQFSPATVGALSRVPPEDRVVGLIQLQAVRSLSEPDLCRVP